MKYELLQVSCIIESEGETAQVSIAGKPVFEGKLSLTLQLIGFKLILHVPQYLLIGQLPFAD
jgi:hypothetical protein